MGAFAQEINGRFAAKLKQGTPLKLSQSLSHLPHSQAFLSYDRTLGMLGLLCVSVSFALSNLSKVSTFYSPCLCFCCFPHHVLTLLTLATDIEWKLCFTVNRICLLSAHTDVPHWNRWVWCANCEVYRIYKNIQLGGVLSSTGQVYRYRGQRKIKLYLIWEVCSYFHPE